MRVTEFVRNALAYRRQRDKLLNQGWMIVPCDGLGDGKITDVRVAEGGKNLYVKISRPHGRPAHMMPASWIDVLRLLDSHHELFAAEMVDLNSRLKRSSIYVVLGGMENDGLVDGVEVPSADGLLPRRKYMISDRGKRILVTLDRETGN